MFILILCLQFKDYLALTSSQLLTFEYLALRFFSPPAWTSTLRSHSTPRSSLSGCFQLPLLPRPPLLTALFTWLLPDKVSCHLLTCPNSSWLGLISSTYPAETSPLFKIHTLNGTSLRLVTRLHPCAHTLPFYYKASFLGTRSTFNSVM